MRAVWRILVGLSLIPAFGTLYQRLTLPESKRFKAAQQHAETEAESIDELKKKADADPGVQEHVHPAPSHSGTPSPTRVGAGCTGTSTAWRAGTTTTDR